MRGFHIRLRDAEVVAYHAQGGVAEEPLESEDVAPVAKVLNSEGVAESVGVNVCHSRAFPEPVQVLAQAVGAQGASVNGEEEVGMWAVVGSFVLDVAPDGPGGGT